MGDCADDLFATLEIDKDTADYNDLMTKLNTHFKIRHNVIVDRARFLNRKQQPGEAVDVFIQDLYKLASDCDLGNLKEELIRDKIVVGVLDDLLSDRLQACADLTLAQPVRMCRQAEARKDNKVVIRGDATSATSARVNYVKQTQSQRTSTGNQQRHSNT